MPDCFGKRYVEAREFLNGIRRLRIYRVHVSDNDLQWLERSRLVVPKLRIQYPDPIARRWWSEKHPEYGCLAGGLEADGPRYEAAVELSEALYRHGNRYVYGPHDQPLDNLDPRFGEFVHQP